MGFEHPGESEPMLGEALRGGYREKVKIATKLPTWLVEGRDDMDRLLDAQLERLETDYIDFYLVHTLNKTLWPRVKKLGITGFLESAMADGRIRHAGFSFHDDAKTFQKLVDAWDWSFCQIQYNFLDEQYQAGRAGLEYAADKGLGVIVMEPLRGGNLVNNLPPEVTRIWNKAETKRTPADWALRWVLDHPEVSMLLSGMSTMEQLTQNIQTAASAEINSLTEKEKELINQVKTVYKNKIQINCTGCGYCLPCPVGVNIPQNFSFFNDHYLFDTPEAQAHKKMIYQAMLTKDEKASRCVECGKCEAHCPQQIPIRQELQDVKRLFES
jgi:hypothetical protein